jgi:hypothetical protein
MMPGLPSQHHQRASRPLISDSGNLVRDECDPQRSKRESLPATLCFGRAPAAGVELEIIHSNGNHVASNPKHLDKIAEVLEGCAEYSGGATSKAIRIMNLANLRKLSAKANAKNALPK